jgi:hypothetical protein
LLFGGWFASAILRNCFNYSLEPYYKVSLRPDLHQKDVFPALGFDDVPLANDDMKIFRLGDRDHALLGANRAAHQPHCVADFHELFVATGRCRSAKVFEISKVIGHLWLLPPPLLSDLRDLVK